MPRKPKPPLPITIIQGLTDGKSFAEVHGMIDCEFTGELIPVDTEALAKAVVCNPKIITDWRQRARSVRLAKDYLTAQQIHAQRERARKMIADKINPPPKPLAYNQIKLGDHMATIKTERKPWRRF